MTWRPRRTGWAPNSTASARSAPRAEPGPCPGAALPKDQMRCMQFGYAPPHVHFAKWVLLPVRCRVGRVLPRIRYAAVSLDFRGLGGEVFGVFPGEADGAERAEVVALHPRPSRGTRSVSRACRAASLRRRVIQVMFRGRPFSSPSA